MDNRCTAIQTCANGPNPMPGRPTVCYACQAGSSSPFSREFPMLFEPHNTVKVELYTPKVPRVTTSEGVISLLVEARSFGLIAQAMLDRTEVSTTSQYVWQTRYATAGVDYTIVQDDWKSLYVFAAEAKHGIDRSLTGSLVETLARGGRMATALTKWHKHDYWNAGEDTRAVEWLLLELGVMGRFQHNSHVPVLGDVAACNNTLNRLLAESLLGDADYGAYTFSY